MSKLVRALVTSLLGAWLSVAACSVVVDPEGLQAGCATGTKACEVDSGGQCVSTSDPEHGCARDSCVPCILPQAIEVCSDSGECAVGTCEPHYENCDLIAKTGCEVDLDTSYEHCGACGNGCDAALRGMAHARSSRCSAGRCAVEQCQDGYADRDGAASNGCERRL